MRFPTAWADLVAMCRTWSRLSGRGRGRGRLGGGGAKRRDQVVVLVFGDAGLRDRKLMDQEGIEIVRKLLGLALVAGIVVGVKKYLDNNPEAKRQVKEQANKAMGQAKHLAEELAGRSRRGRRKLRTRWIRLPTGNPGSTSTTSSATTPNDPATGAPTTL